MADNTKIEWTDATWNPITGCTLVSDGCRNCYAAQLAATRLKHHPSRVGLARLNAEGVAKFTGEVRFNAEWLDQPLRWKKPRMIFVCAHGDLFHESVPDAWIDHVFAVMALAPQHIFQVLTKRPERMRNYLLGCATDAGRGRLSEVCDAVADSYRPGSSLPGSAFWANWYSQCEGDAPLPNVWLGTSVEDQPTADERIPELLATPAVVRWVSAEPLLGLVDLTNIDAGVHDDFSDCGGHPDPTYPLQSVAWGRTDALSGQYWSTTRTPDGKVWNEHEQLGYTLPTLDWVVCGGESGNHARPMHPAWARSLRDQCATAGVPFLFKQWGHFRPLTDAERRTACGATLIGRDPHNSDNYVLDVGKKRAGRHLDGVEHDGFPGARP